MNFTSPPTVLAPLPTPVTTAPPSPSGGNLTVPGGPPLPLREEENPEPAYAGVPYWVPCCARTFERRARPQGFPHETDPACFERADLVTVAAERRPRRAHATDFVLEPAARAGILWRGTRQLPSRLKPGTHLKNPEPLVVTRRHPPTTRLHPPEGGIGTSLPSPARRWALVSTTGFSTATTLIYANGAGITAAAGT